MICRISVDLASEMNKILVAMSQRKESMNCLETVAWGIILSGEVLNSKKAVNSEEDNRREFINKIWVSYMTWNGPNTVGRSRSTCRNFLQRKTSLRKINNLTTLQSWIVCVSYSCKHLI
jgi:hypothetical protein